MKSGRLVRGFTGRVGQPDGGLDAKGIAEQCQGLAPKAWILPVPFHHVGEQTLNRLLEAIVQPGQQFPNMQVRIEVDADLSSFGGQTAVRELGFIFEMRAGQAMEQLGIRIELTMIDDNF